MYFSKFHYKSNKRLRGISKTLRFPEDIVNDIQNLADLKNLYFNKIVISLLEFGLKNLDDEDKKELEKLNKS